ncbi:hypothetical protein [Nocardia australiensis]|uniref:hypothetical protein n=1 Tax=Nocardia australiensis TaxID=2887191 RepID=UPI001D15858D|nr:hypothetical protein [Nocardia australiensis]
MRPWRDFLERFRPTGTPGAAALRGVPADRAGDAESELGLLLALLDDARTQAEQIRADAVERARGIRARARGRAEEMVLSARQHTESARAEAVGRARAQNAAEQDALRNAAAAEIERMRTAVAVRMPDYVARVRSETRALIDGSNRNSEVGP